MDSTTVLELNPAAGARNLLVNCAQCREGERLLIAFESENHGYFDDDVRRYIEEEARSLDLNVTLFDVGFDPTRRQLPNDLAELIAEYDTVVFLSRLGDQLRFSDLPAGPRFVVCFAWNSHLLGSVFGCADYEALCKVKHEVDRAIMSARRIVVTCPNGTEIVGRVPDGNAVSQDTTVRRFPMSVFSPVPAGLFSGRVALGGFLTGTGSRYYENYSVEFEGPVFALLESGRLSGFDGSVADVTKANAHYDRVAELFSLDRDFVHSWHAGIHPGCGFPWDLRQNFERWGGVAFGNPRVLHFHTCGAYPPGEISWNAFDPTIELDGLKVWDNGRLRLERLAGGARILSEYPELRALFANPNREIGFGDLAQLDSAALSIQ